MSSTASNYDVSRLSLGILTVAVAALLVLPATSVVCARSRHPGIFLTFLIIGYGLMMFASSYVEEEQQFWYWICSGWIVYLHIRPKSGRASSPWITQGAGLGLLLCQRLLRRWNQTGQKFAAEPDIARTFFVQHPNLLWSLVILTYADSGVHLLWRVPRSVLTQLGAMVLAVLAFGFKLNFISSDSPELLEGSFLSRAVKGYPTGLSLVLHARLVFLGLASLVLSALFIRDRPGSARARNKLLHEALSLFLMTQSRAANIPMFLVFRVQAILLSSLTLTALEVTITTLIAQYMTFFAFGGSNAISSIDLSNAYNGVGSYSMLLVGVLTFVGNWAGPIWWVSASHLFHPDEAPNAQQDHASLLTFHVAMSVFSVMAACTALRTHLFIWTVFSPKFLYTMAWATINHVAINLVGGAGLARLRSKW
jgi:ethanolaminephosphotransferase